MNYLINLYNQVGAGPRNISLNLISELRKTLGGGQHYYVIVPDYEDYQVLESEPGLTLIKLPRYESLWMKMLYRMYLDFVRLPQLVNKHGIASVLAFGNFLIAPLRVRKTVLLHHPYIFDDRQLARLPLLARCIEQVKRIAFCLTLRNVDYVVVQSEYVREKLRMKWPWYHGGIQIIDNPVSNRLAMCTDAEIERYIAVRKATLHDTIELLYVSRFYPHKNHSFLIPLSQAMQTRGFRHQILITIDPQIPGAITLLEQIKASGLPIVNLGEIDQAALSKHYTKAHALLFPSCSETFGNPLMEALGYGLPVIAPDLDYAHAVLADTGQYYAEDNADDCASRVLALTHDVGHYETICRDARRRFFKFLSADVWVQRYLELITGEKCN